MQQETVNVFIAYAREDAVIKERLKKNLKAIFRNNQADSLWDDGEINAGDDWQKAIGKALEQADIFLLLLSPDFIASDFCYETEMQKALEKHQKEEAIVIPLQIRACSWQNSPLKELQILPEDGKAIHRSNEQHILDELYLQITEKLHHISNAVKEQKRIKKLKEEFDHTYAKAELHIKYGEWLIASDEYRKALSLRIESFEVSQEVILSNIDKCMRNLKYEELREELNDALKKEELLKAKNVIEELIMLRPSILEKEDLMIDEGGPLFEAYSVTADKFFLNNKWQEAEIEYKKAILSCENEYVELFVDRLVSCANLAYPKPYQQDGKWGFLNYYNYVVIPFEYEEVIEFCNGLAPVRKHNKWGFVDIKGNTVIPFEFDEIETNYEDFLFTEKIKVKKDGVLFCIDKTGQRVSCD